MVNKETELALMQQHMWGIHDGQFETFAKWCPECARLTK